jgi:hypothetical protein
MNLLDLAERYATKALEVAKALYGDDPCRNVERAMVRGCG